MKHGCFVDKEATGEIYDTCLLDTGDELTCDCHTKYARKEDCPFWIGYGSKSLPWQTKQHDMGLFLYDANENMVAGPINDRPDKVANARLIAAAPEMLAMLEELEWIDVDYDFCPICGGNKATSHDTDCKLGNLLHRARGEQ